MLDRKEVEGEKKKRAQRQVEEVARSEQRIEEELK